MPDEEEWAHAEHAADGDPARGGRTLDEPTHRDRAQEGSRGESVAIGRVVCRLDPEWTCRVARMLSCSWESGGAVRTRATPASMTSPRLMPTTSEIRLPNPAAAIVDRPNLTPAEDSQQRVNQALTAEKKRPWQASRACSPSVQSIWSPITIMMKLSAKPKPTKGTPDASASVASCERVGLRMVDEDAPASPDGGAVHSWRRRVGRKLPLAREAMAAPARRVGGARNDDDRSIIILI